MNRYLFLVVTLTIFYLINQPDLVSSSSAGSWGNGASKLNLGVWIPPMTLRLPKFNMPKIKISATIKPRKNQPPMKIHLPEMSLNAKALGDDEYGGGHGGGNSYGGGGGSSYDSGSSYSGGDSYSGGSSGPQYSSGGGGESYSGGSSGPQYSSGGGESYSSGPSNGYRSAAASSNTNQNSYPASNSEQYQSAPQPNYNTNQNNNNNEYSRYQPVQQDQRNAYYVDNSSQQQSSRYPAEAVSYGATNSIQSGYRPVENSYSSRSSTSSVPSSSGSIVAPLSNYAKREKRPAGNSEYGYGVSSQYGPMNSARYARH